MIAYWSDWIKDKQLTYKQITLWKNKIDICPEATPAKLQPTIAPKEYGIKHVI